MLAGCPFISPNFNSPNSNYRIRVRIRDRVRVRVRFRVRRIEIRRSDDKEPRLHLFKVTFYSGIDRSSVLKSALL